MKVATCPGCRRTRLAVRKGSSYIVRRHGCQGDRHPVGAVRDPEFRRKRSAK